MASLPPGWKADYDGQRWFFTYEPTGQSQFQFPRPGDEFPDFWCCAVGPAGAAANMFPPVDLMPEERLESERQVRRMLNASGGTGEAVEDKGDVRRRTSPVREGDGDGERNVCFESFAAVKSRGRQGLCGDLDGARTGEQRGHDVGNGIGLRTRTSVADTSEESTGEQVSLSLVTEGEHTQVASSPRRAEGSAATIAIMSEPVLAVVETTPAAPSLGHQSEHQPAAAARSSSPELQMLDGRVIDSALTPLTGLSVASIPELYNESTALCEIEINPPPVELPGNDGDWSEHKMASNLAIQKPVELPAYEGRSMSRGKESSTAGLEPKSCVGMTWAGDHEATSNAGSQETGGKSRCHDRAALPSQASRVSSKFTLGKTSRRGSVDSAQGQKHPTRETEQPAESCEAGRRDLTHFPSVLRPGPRRSSQPQPQQPRAAMPTPIVNIPHAARARQGQPQEGSIEAGSVPRGEPARMPAMPVLDHPREAVETVSTTSPGVPHAGGARQNRLPGSVNFVIPIQHISRGDFNSAQEMAVVGSSPKYHVSASFASVTSSEQPRGTGGQIGGGSPGLLPSGGKSELWSHRPADGAAVSTRVVGARSATDVPDWSWGYAR